MKIMVIDTQGPEISKAYRDLLPTLHIRGLEPDFVEGTPCHEHGAFCGWLAGLPVVAAGIHAEFVFLRIFDQQANWIPGSEEYMLDMIARERPDYITRSWGAWDGDDGLAQFWAQTSFSEFTPAYRDLCKRIGFVDFGPAGNSDENDRDNDVDFPQCDMLDFCNVIGACQRNGVPTTWTGDGKGVQCLMWGDLIYSPDMAGKWHLWSGTSSATPKACGACAALMLDRDLWQEYVESTATFPADVGSLPHPKYGYGCMEEAWQSMARLQPQRLMPPPAPVGPAASGITPEWFDFKRVR